MGLTTLLASYVSWNYFITYTLASVLSVEYQDYIGMTRTYISATSLQHNSK